MNNGTKVEKTDVLVFPIKPQEADVSEVKSVKIEEVVESEIRIIQTNNRFARLKKTLRKRSASIL